MTNPIHILGISGSLRRASWNTGLLRAAAELLPEGADLEIADLSAVPLYNQDNEPDPPAAVRDLKDRIRAADALLIATPEYNYSFPGVLKNVIDWVSRPRAESPLIGKPTAILGAGGRFGTVRAQLHLRQVLVETGQLVLPKPELMIPMAWEKFDSSGDLTDETVRKQLADLVAALVGWTARLR